MEKNPQHHWSLQPRENSLQRNISSNRHRRPLCCWCLALRAARAAAGTPACLRHSCVSTGLPMSPPLNSPKEAQLKFTGIRQFMGCVDTLGICHSTSALQSVFRRSTARSLAPSGSLSPPAGSSVRTCRGCLSVISGGWGLRARLALHAARVSQVHQGHKRTPLHVTMTPGAGLELTQFDKRSTVRFV